MACLLVTIACRSKPEPDAVDQYPDSVMFEEQIMETESEVDPETVEMPAAMTKGAIVFLEATPWEITEPPTLDARSGQYVVRLERGGKTLVVEETKLLDRAEGFMYESGPGYDQYLDDAREK
jgi:hypothetical protein